MRRRGRHWTGRGRTRHHEQSGIAGAGAAHAPVPVTVPGAGGDRPRVALLVAHWGEPGESGYVTRQVAGALAWEADIHVVTPDGTVPGTEVDSVFRIHRLATPVDRAAELRRDLLVDAWGAADAAGGAPPASDLDQEVDRGVIEPWAGATDVLARLDPDFVVIAGHRTVGALSAVDDLTGDRPVVLLALALHGDGVDFPRYAALQRRAAAILAVTNAERSALVGASGRADAVRCIGAPLSANPTARSEPNPWVGDTGYVLVRTDAAADDTGTAAADLARILRLRFPERPVGVCHTDAFCVWHQGRRSTGWPVTRSSDLARLMAWAAVTVDLRPGALFARECVESLLHGAPVVVPRDSRALEHARRGGGLWFGDAAEMITCVETVLQPRTRAALSEQGQASALATYGSTARFVELVTDACGLGGGRARARQDRSS